MLAGVQSIQFVYCEMRKIPHKRLRGYLGANQTFQNKHAIKPMDMIL
jgi:hypothetical protein